MKFENSILVVGSVEYMCPEQSTMGAGGLKLPITLVIDRSNEIGNSLLQPEPCVGSYALEHRLTRVRGDLGFVS